MMNECIELGLEDLPTFFNSIIEVKPRYAKELFEVLKDNPEAMVMYRDDILEFSNKLIEKDSRLTKTVKDFLQYMDVNEFLKVSVVNP